MNTMNKKRQFRALARAAMTYGSSDEGSIEARTRAILLVILFVVLVVGGLLITKTSSSNHASSKITKTSSANNASQRSKVSPPLSVAAKNHNTSNKSGIPFALPSAKGAKPGPDLTSWSNPSVLPSDVLIADEGNNRLLLVNPAGKIVWMFPRPGDLAPGQTFLSPDDAFFTPNGKDIVATEENDQVISLISIASHKILWRYGTPGVPGAGVNQLSNPDDAMMMPNGDIITADIKNCSILILRPPLHAPIERIGENTTFCYHQPPLRFGSPNGAFPMTNGNYMVSEINGDWASEMTLGGKILWSTHPPGVAYPSDTNEIGPNRFLTVDYSDPGQIVEFNSAGQLLWRYRPTSGAGKLTTPSLCEMIPTNGDILCNDDGNDRVIVVNPRTNQIVWQYGHDGVVGSAPGYLSGPDGVDLAPPYSMDVRNAKTMGSAVPSCASGLPAGACTVFSTK